MLIACSPEELGNQRPIYARRRMNDQVRDGSKTWLENTCDPFHSLRRGDRYTHAGGSSRRACSSQAPLAGAVHPLANRANPSGPHPEWLVYLLGLSGL